ncbi:GIY-YIG nuclease family protein [Zunongwangia sp. HGR-M22]
MVTNKYRTVFYTGITNDLRKRIAEHHNGNGSKFTSKY